MQPRPRDELKGWQSDAWNMLEQMINLETPGWGNPFRSQSDEYSELYK